MSRTGVQSLEYRPNVDVHNNIIDRQKTKWEHKPNVTKAGGCLIRIDYWLPITNRLKFVALSSLVEGLSLKVTGI